MFGFFVRLTIFVKNWLCTSNCGQYSFKPRFITSNNKRPLFKIISVFGIVSRSIQKPILKPTPSKTSINSQLPGAAGGGGGKPGPALTVSVKDKTHAAGSSNWGGFLYHVVKFSASQLLKSISQPGPAGACGSPP